MGNTNNKIFINHYGYLEVFDEEFQPKDTTIFILRPNYCVDTLVIARFCFLLLLSEVFFFFFLLSALGSFWTIDQIVPLYHMVLRSYLDCIFSWICLYLKQLF
jgi:hypothetical protein